MKEKNWHSLSINYVFSELKTNNSGLTETEAVKRLKKFGLNELPKKQPLGKLFIFFNQFKNSLVVVLLIAALVSYFLSDMIDAYVILAAVFLNVVIGYFQENKAQDALLKLKKVIVTQALVIRNAKEKLIATRDLVPGDIIRLVSGDKVPADVRLIEINNLEIEEAGLTGESMPVYKNLNKLKQGVALADRLNMAYQGTVVLKGKAMGVVVATGNKTELGKIAEALREIKEETTPLQKKLVIFSHQLAYLFLCLCFLIFLIGVIIGYPALIMFNTSIAIAVSAIPEGLLISITVILAIGMQIILKKKALVTKMISAETLGSTTVICTDKTGTLTTGEMQVAHLEAYNQKYSFTGKNLKEKLMAGRDILLALKIGMLVNEAIILNEEDDLADWQIIGGATDKAILLAGIQAGLNKKELEKETPLLDELPFDSELKIMATLRKFNEKENIIYLKGAPEKIIDKLTEIESGNGRVLITPGMKEKIKKNFENLSNKGLRMLALAYRIVPKDINKIKQIFPQAEIQGLTWVGLVGLKDPLRPEAAQTIKLAQMAGLKIVVITGDNKITARAIAMELGLKVNNENILDGTELLKYSDDQLFKKVKSIIVYSRVTPQDKLRIIKAWKAHNEVVAMTGDGINDAPALKQADIGIALGSGTEVAKETADVILLDNNFSTIIAAIRQGRVIYDNIKKVILYLLSDSFSEIIVIIGSFLLSLPLPFFPAQILWINIIADGLPNYALTMEPEEKGLLKEKPYPRNLPVLDTEKKLFIILISLISGIGILAIFYLFYNLTRDIDLSRTIAFAALGTNSLLYVFSCRSIRNSIFNKQFFSNIYLIGAVIIGFLLQIAAIYWLPLQKILRTKPLDLDHWFYIIAVGLIIIFTIEILKSLFFMREKKLVKI